MKKILSLLTAITLTASGTSSVISCGSNTKTNAASKKAVDAIKAKIVKTTLSIQGGNINSDASKAINKPIIDLALRSENAVLSLDDLKQISYSGTLTPKSTKTIKATITIGSGVEKASTTIDLSITWNETNQEAANSFATSLKDKNISISFIQKNTDTKASAYVSEITTQLKTQVPGNYNIAFATTADGEKNLLKSTDTSVNIKVTVNGEQSTVTASINIKFSDNSKVVKANNFATSLNGQSIEFMQQDSRNKVSDYNDTIKTELQKKVPGNYDIKLTQTEGNKTLTKSDIEVDVTVTFGGVDSTRTAKVNMKFTDNSNIVKANNFANQLNNLSISFVQQGTNTKVSDYTSDILSALKTQKAGNYTISFATPTEGNKTLSKTNITIDIKAIVNSITSTTTATINVKFSDNSDIVKADNFVIDLNNKSIDFMQKNTDTKASAYVSDITTKLQDQVAGNYTFTFDGTDGNIDLTTTAQQIKIKIEVNGVSSTSSATINMKFTDNSDIVKANNFANQLNNLSISFVQQGTNTKASDYTAEILSALKTQKAGNYTISFATPTEGDKTLSKTNITIDIKAIVNSITSTTIATINVKFSDSSDIVKANSIVSTLKSQSLNPIILNIDNNKRKISDYFTSQIKAILEVYLTNKEKTYNYSLVNTDDISNISKDFNVNVRIGNDTSTDSFQLKISFNYRQAQQTPQNTSIIKKIDNILYIGTDNGLYYDENNTGFTLVTGIPQNLGITTIDQFGGKIYIGTTIGLYKSDDATGKTFSIITGTTARLDITSSVVMEDLWPAPNRSSIFIGSTRGLYETKDGLNFNKITGSGVNVLPNDPILSLGKTDKGEFAVGLQGKGFYYTTNGGGNFYTTSTNISSLNISFIKEIDNKYFFGTQSNGLWTSANLGGAKQQINTIGDTYINTVKKINNIYYVAANNGLYISKDNGATFTKVSNQDIPNVPIYSIEQNGSTIIISTKNGIYYNEL